MDVPEDPGMLLLLLDNERKVLIKEEMWKPIEIEFTSPPVNVNITLVGNKVSAISLAKE